MYNISSPNEEPSVTHKTVKDFSRAETEGAIYLDENTNLYINKLSHPDYHLLKPIGMRREITKNHVFLLNSQLNVCSSGEDTLQALEEFQNILYAHYDSYALCDDVKLTKNARILKRFLNEYISKN